MSLINEALKKAQRQRHDGDAPGAVSGPDSGGSIAKRTQPKSARSMLLIAVGAVVLVVASIVGTALWLTRSGTTATTGALPVTAPESKVAELPAIHPNVSLPSPTPPPALPAETKRTTPSRSPATAPNATTQATAQEVATAAPAASAPAEVETAATTPAVEQIPAPPAAVTQAAPVPPAKPDERVHQYVDALKVAGIRSSGADSKVLMNDRVYRVNDIVDRTLGIRLTKVSAESLTFTDANGVTYVKYF